MFERRIDFFFIDQIFRRRVQKRRILTYAQIITRLTIIIDVNEHLTGINVIYQRGSVLDFKIEIDTGPIVLANVFLLYI